MRLRYVVIVLRQVCMLGMIISKCRMVEQREGACLWGMWPCIYWPHFCRCLPQGRGWTHGPHVISMKSYRGMCSHLALVTSLVCLIVFDLWMALCLPSNHSTFDTSRHCASWNPPYTSYAPSCITPWTLHVSAAKCLHLEAVKFVWCVNVYLYDAIVGVV